MEENDEKPGPSTDRGQARETDADRWKTYMSMKKSKLMHQINYANKEDPVSNIFSGISIYVNGYTDPPASELRRIMQRYGGEYHVYYEYGVTTYTVATHIAKTKYSKLKKDEKIVHPKYITDCIKANMLLPDKDYLLPKEGGLPDAVKKANLGSSRNASNDPNFIDNFYERSRLHLISSLAQEMKQFVQELRQSPPETFSSRHLLSSLSKSNFLEAPKETICHVDLDCFFVSVALRSFPDLIGKPVAVTHSRGTDYGVGLSDIASCSYEARATGVRNGMSVREAKKLCPNIICVPYQFDEYRTISKNVYEVVSRYTVDIRAVSCDEVYIDLGSLCKEMRIDDVMGIVSVIRGEIHRETGCVASVGVGSNMLIARLATHHAKPNGQYLVRDEDVSSFIKKEKISLLPGIGYSTRAKLNEAFGDLNTCGELQAVPVEKLQTLLGSKTGLQLYNLCRGIDKERKLLEISSRKSVSCDVNYGIRFTRESEFYEFLKKLASQLENKMIVARVTGSAVTLRLLIRAPDAPVEPAKYMGCGKCDVITRSSRLLSKPISTAAAIFGEAKNLARIINPVISDLRGIGLQVTHLKEVQNSKRPQKSAPRTLADFFKVQGPSSRKNVKKTVDFEEDLLFKRAVRESIRDEAERKLRVFEQKQIVPVYRCTSNDFEVKAKMLQVLSCPPGEREMNELADYFYQLVEYEDYSTLVSQIRFLERKALGHFANWLVPIIALKMFLKEVCYGQLGHQLTI